jgi:hypothetical protein
MNIKGLELSFKSSFCEQSEYKGGGCVWFFGLCPKNQTQILIIMRAKRATVFYKKALMKGYSGMTFYINCAR